MEDRFRHILREDLDQIFLSDLPWQDLNGKRILITGATGMLASYLVHFLLYLSQEKDMDIKVLALCRNKGKAETMFGNSDALKILEQDICSPLDIEGEVDLIFHFAGNASPYFINTDPVGICRTNLTGTFNVAELARKKSASVIFASTREVYGKNEEAGMLDEKAFGTSDCMEDRACYPESKRAAETVLHSYFLQYGVPVYVLRIAHVFGPGMRIENDGRVMSDFISDAVAGRDIILKSDGTAIRAFCYITDAISGIFTALMKGRQGEAYNLADETHPLTIRKAAELTAEAAGVHVRTEIGTNMQGYCNYRRTGLDTSRLESLGWKPNTGIEEAITRTIESFR